MGDEANVPAGAGEDVRVAEGVVPEAAGVKAKPATKAKPAAKTRRAAKAGAGRKAKRVRWSVKREKMFLDALAETSNVAEAARQSGLSNSNVYARRQADEAFRARWMAALRDGYAKLESEVLERALNGVEKPVFHGGKAVASVRQFNDQVALRLLTLHRATVNGQPAAAAVPVAERRAALGTRLARMNRRMGGAG